MGNSVTGHFLELNICGGSKSKYIIGHFTQPSCMVGLSLGKHEILHLMNT